MSTSRTTGRKAATARRTPTRSVATRAALECAMPACTDPRVRGKAYCATHVPVARERARTAAGDSAWS